MAERLSGRKLHALALFVLAIAAASLVIFSQRPGGQMEPERMAAPAGEGAEGVAVLQEDILLIDGTRIPAGTRYAVQYPPQNLLPGGPPKDGIPSIDNPKFEPAGQASEWLPDDAFVLGLDYNGVSKAYPHRILNWHEIVNDFAGDRPVLVSYCPLCRSGIAFEPLIGGERVEFGTSGKLYNSDLVMYDRKTGSYWSQVAAVAILGPLAGTELKPIPLETTTWGRWKARHPDTLVLSRDTGFVRNYGVEDIYGIYGKGFSGIGVRFTDTRLSSNDIVHGVRFRNKTKAYWEGAVKRDRVINDEVGGVPVVVWWDPLLESAKIFLRDLDGDTLSFRESEGGIVDNLGRRWSFDGESGELSLKRLSNFGNFWFAWLAFYPDTELYK